MEHRAGSVIVPGLALAVSALLLLATLAFMADQIVGLASGALETSRDEWVLPALAIEAMGVLFLAATAWAGLRALRRARR